MREIRRSLKQKRKVKVNLQEFFKKETTTKSKSFKMDKFYTKIAQKLKENK